MIFFWCVVTPSLALIAICLVTALLTSGDNESRRDGGGKGD